MNVRPKRISKAMDAIALVQLNSAEKLRVAECLMEDVLASLSPLTDPVMCVADGTLQVAHDATEQAREYVANWQDDDLPVPGL